MRGDHHQIHRCTNEHDVHGMTHHYSHQYVTNGGVLEQAKNVLDSRTAINLTDLFLGKPLGMQTPLLSPV